MLSSTKLNTVYKVHINIFQFYRWFRKLKYIVAYGQWSILWNVNLNSPTQKCSKKSNDDILIILTLKLNHPPRPVSFFLYIYIYIYITKCIKKLLSIRTYYFIIKLLFFHLKMLLTTQIIVELAFL